MHPNGAPSPGFELTDITYHRHVRLGIVRVAFNRPEVRNAFRPHTVDELYAALEHARIVQRRRRRAADRQRPVAEGRRLGILLRRRSTDPRRPRLSLRGRRRVGGGCAEGPRPREAGSPAHPRGAAAHPLHAEGRDRRGPRLGRRRRAQPARRLRSDARQRRARDVQADRCRRRELRRRLRLGVPREDGRPEEGAGDLFPRRRVHGRASRGDGRGQRGGAARRARERRRSRGARRSSARARPPSGC